MEFAELTEEQHRQFLRNVIANHERRYLSYEMDAKRYQTFLKELDAGGFGNMPKQVRQQKAKHWQQQLSVAQMNMRETELSIDDAKARLAALPDPPAGEEADEEALADG